MKRSQIQENDGTVIRYVKNLGCPRAGLVQFYITLRGVMECAPHDALARPHDKGDLDRYLAEFDKVTRQAYADDITVQG